MNYQILPMGEVWSEGMFSVPSVITNKYIRLASAYQLKALLVVLASGGNCTSHDISAAIGVPESEVCELMQFWSEEGILVTDGELASPAPKKENAPTPKAEKTEKKKEKVVEAMPVPTLNPSDIAAALRESEELQSLMQEAEVVLGGTLSHVQKQLLVNMVNYYGLPCEVALTILQYYKTERDSGNAISWSYVAAMAKNWCEEGINTLSAADEKLKELESSDKLWNSVVEMSGIRFRKPTAKQREMLKEWKAAFNMEMIALACDTMRENAQRPTLKYVDTVLKNWRKKGISTPEQVEKENEKFISEKEKSGKSGEIVSTYDLDKIIADTVNNDNYDI